ncbi:hypothetical protein E3N88_03561 [Mikania micrantha]|uniref:Uncharacterized protein n=1 Tax=Mikania micrantha TaxID=192012 RepID=A0A5N6Q6X0_9ASTR|nr:hypothetical protein E3N88_03561 [Mikania micrantha]
MDEVEDNDYEEELLDYDDNEKAPDSVNNKSGAETVKKYASIFSSSVCFLLTVLEPEDGGGRGTSGTFGSDFVYGYSDGLQFVRIKNGEAHDCLVCSQYFVVSAT